MLAGCLPCAVCRIHEVAALINPTITKLDLRPIEESGRAQTQ